MATFAALASSLHKEILYPTEWELPFTHYALFNRMVSTGVLRSTVVPSPN
jgi:hypothetical protein